MYSTPFVLQVASCKLQLWSSGTELTWLFIVVASDSYVRTVGKIGLCYSRSLQ
jgi:hypothetical protein